MLKRVTKVLVGKDIARTASLVIYGAGSNLKAGEVFLADKNRKLLGATPTVATTDSIYIGSGSSETYNYVTETGTSVTGVRKIVWSDLIQANGVQKYTGAAYSAPAQSTYTLSGSLTPIIGTEYVIRIQYKELPEHYGVYSQEYRHIATTTTLADLYSAFVAKINRDSHSRVVASATTGPDVLTITAKALPENDSVDAIDEYFLVLPEIFLTSDNFGSAVLTHTVNPNPGQGTWQQVRDAEKSTLHDQFGASNRTIFPVILPALNVVKDETYDSIVIAHNTQFKAPDNRYRTTSKTTVIYLPDGAAQTATILADLNAWMASTPGAFGAVSF